MNLISITSLLINNTNQQKLFSCMK